MPRKPRMYLPGVPAHVLQRGNDQNYCFFKTNDYQFYLTCLDQALKRYHVQLHAYVLMPDHVHLLMTPTETEGISKVMSLLGQQYVRYINRTYQRSGPLWGGRHKASLVDAEEYLLRCYRYIESNPMRSGLVNSPEEYPWSSYRHHTWGKINPYIKEHKIYLDLGQTNEERQYAYRELFNKTLSEQETHKIRSSFHYNYPLGNQQFKEQIETILNRRIGYAKRGRPPLQQRRNTIKDPETSRQNTEILNSRLYA